MVLCGGLTDHSALMAIDVRGAVHGTCFDMFSMHPANNMFLVLNCHGNDDTSFP